MLSFPLFCRRSNMILYFLLFWSLVINSSSVLSAERQDFNLEDYAAESPQWNYPNADVFSYSEEPTADNLFELLGSARDAIQNDQLHVTIEACQSRILSLNQQVRNNNVNVQRLVKHLIRIYEQSKDSHKGVIFMKITSEDMKVLKSFADDGKFSSHTHTNVHDLLKESLNLPTKTLLDKLLPMFNMFAWILNAIWGFIVNTFQNLRFLLMQFAFSPDLVIYASMFLPVIVLGLSLWRKYSIKASFFSTGAMVMVIAYFVELRNAFETARAKDMAKLSRSRNIPRECLGEELGYFDWTMSAIRSLFTSEDRCERYYRDQIPEPTIEISEVFWKIVFAPVTVAMDKFGYGLRLFMASFGGNLGWFSSIVLIPVGMIALLLFLVILFAFVTGGSISLPFFGKVSFRNPWDRTGEPATADRAARSPGGASSQPAITNVYNYHLFNSTHPTPAQIPTNLNLAITAANGQTLQITSHPSPESNTPSSSLTVSPSGQLVRSIPAAPGNSSLEIAASNQVSASTSGEHGPRFSETSLLPSLLSTLSETDSNRSFDTSGVTNHCALREIGSGDFEPRDLMSRMLPSAVHRWRNNRKLSRWCVRKRHPRSYHTLTR